MAGYESSLLDKPSEWFLVGLEDLNFKVVREFLSSSLPPGVFIRCLKNGDSDLSFSLLLLYLLTCSFDRQCIFFPDSP